MHRRPHPIPPPTFCVFCLSTDFTTSSLSPHKIITESHLCFRGLRPSSPSCTASCLSSSSMDSSKRRPSCGPGQQRCSVASGAWYRPSSCDHCRCCTSSCGATHRYCSTPFIARTVLPSGLSASAHTRTHHSTLHHHHCTHTHLRERSLLPHQCIVLLPLRGRHRAQLGVHAVLDLGKLVLRLPRLRGGEGVGPQG